MSSGGEYRAFFLLGCGVLLSSFLYGQRTFVDATTSAGINHSFQVFQGTFGGGAAVLDYDNDGMQDLFLTGGVGGDVLYHNNGDGTFSDVSERTGLQNNDTLITQGATTADVNKDGWVDIFVTTIASSSFGRVLPRANDILYVNNGDGTFSDRSVEFGFTLKTFSTGAAFGDFNGDGYPDLYVGNYFDDFEGALDKINTGVITGSQRPSHDQLYLNNAGINFTEVAAQYGITHEGFGFGAIFTDFDNDRDLDLHVVNDFGNRTTPNKMYVNAYPRQEFKDAAAELAIDFGINAMGTAVGDYNRDGLLDYVVTNISVSPFVVNQGPEQPFLEQATALGTAFNSLLIDGTGAVAPVSWGCNFFDFDHDTDLDLHICNGALNPPVTPNPNLFLQLDGTRYQERSVELGLDDSGLGRGSVVFDYDNDGDLDLFVVNQRPVENAGLLGSVKSKLYRNDASDGNWLKIQLKGRSATTRGLGSRIEVEAGGLIMIQEIDGGSSHESQNTTIAHFGLSDLNQADVVRVHWIGGGTQELNNISANQMLVITQDANQVIESPFDQGDIRIYPSYFQESVTVEYQLPAHVTHRVVVIDENGQIVDTIIEDHESFFGNLRWDVPAHLHPGLYFFTVYFENDKLVARGFKK